MHSKCDDMGFLKQQLRTKPVIIDRMVGRVWLIHVKQDCDNQLCWDWNSRKYRASQVTGTLKTIINWFENFLIECSSR